MPDLTDFGGKPAHGAMSYPVFAVVDDIEDPDQQGRIKVSYKSLSGAPVSWWARQARPDAGPNRGLFSTPEVGDEVLVVFAQGSYDNPIIVGQLWNGPNALPDEALGTQAGSGSTDTGGTVATGMFTDGSCDYNANDVRLWRSREGHVIMMDDTSGSESVQIWDKSYVLCLAFDTASSLITLSNTKGDIEIRAKNDINIDAGNDIKVYAKNNIEVESKMESKWTSGMNWKLEAKQNIEAKATMDVKIEATMNFEAKATMDAKIEGTMNFSAKGGIEAKLEGSAMGVVKGGVVMIN